MRKLVLLPAIALELLVVLTRPAAACYCVPPAQVAEGVQAVDAVFTGTVLRVEEGEATVAVQSRFKGDVRSVVVLPNGEAGDCGYIFEVDRSYLVYASESDAPNRFSTSICNRTAPLEESQGEIAQLVLLITPKSAGWLDLDLSAWTLAAVLGAAVLLVILALLVARRHSHHTSG